MAAEAISAPACWAHWRERLVDVLLMRLYRVVKRFAEGPVRGEVRHVKPDPSVPSSERLKLTFYADVEEDRYLELRREMFEELMAALGEFEKEAIEEHAIEPREARELVRKLFAMLHLEVLPWGLEDEAGGLLELG